MRGAALTSWLAGPVLPYREVQQRFHRWCKAVPGAAKELAARFPVSPWPAGDLVRMLMAGPLPLSSCDAFSLSQLLCRGGGAEADRAAFLRLCRGELLEAALD